MTHDEFTAAAKCYQRQQLWAMAPMFATLLLVLLWMIVEPAFVDFLQGRLDPSLIEVVRVAPVALLVVAGLGSIVPASNRIERKHGVHCPACRAQIASFPGIVIASKHCPKCGGPVIDGTC